MKMYSYCLSFKWTNYLKACDGGGMGIDDLRIPCLAMPSIWLPDFGHLFLSFIALNGVAFARCGKAPLCRVNYTMIGTLSGNPN